MSLSLAVESSEVLLALLMLFTFTVPSAEVVISPIPSSCPANCGDIGIFYPFGIGQGCFRPGFDLTCNTSTTPPKLFIGNTTIQVMNLGTPGDSPEVTINATVVTLGVNNDFSNGSLIDLQNKLYLLHIFAKVPDQEEYISWFHNVLWVFGCNAIAYLVDLQRNARLGSCSTICPAEEKRNLTSCDGIGCCVIDNIMGNVSYVGVQLERINSTADMPLASSTAITAFITTINGDLDPPGTGVTASIGRYFNQGISVTTGLGWYMNEESSCEEAVKNNNSYACLSSNSFCLNIISQDPFLYPKSQIGYTCQCSEGHQGNPYLPNGCQGGPTVVPKSNCERKCGSIYIPFPFGLEEGCYREDTFALFCNRTQHAPMLCYQGNMVTNISVETRLLEYTDIPCGGGKYSSLLYENITYGDHGTIIMWVIDDTPCSDAWKNKTTYACRSKYSSCSDAKIIYLDHHRKEVGYGCSCVVGYSGNPYLDNGCSDINECADPNSYSCDGICVCPLKPLKKGIFLILGACIGMGLLLVIASIVILHRKWKKRKAKRLREKFFHQNHGLLLQQLISATVDPTTNPKIFTLEELEKATNNFDQTRILGQGGHGTVYKGILSDQRVVAIKKSKISLQREVNQFINEVAILSQINHRNIVKLFGCCLETKVPLLIYEFVSNGTVYDRLHCSNFESQLSWEDRLRIASEVAGALTYLHSSASISIFHRDVKSSNIILDEYYTAKVSDFGASRSIPTDQTRVTTAIQGTFGYLDPEYYQTGQLTEKSDVYSFGVILLELLTGKKPVCPREGQEDMNLAMLFLQAMRENRLYELLDDCILNNDTTDDIDQMLDLAKMCLKLRGDERPTMKAVEHKLQALRRKKLNTKEWFGLDCPENEHLLGSVHDVSRAFQKQLYDGGAVTASARLGTQSMSSINQGR